MIYDPGDLVAINTPSGYRVWPLAKYEAPDWMKGVERGTRAIVLDIVPVPGFKLRHMAKLLVGGSGVWWVDTTLVSRVRLEFRHNELWTLKKRGFLEQAELPR